MNVTKRAQEVISRYKQEKPITEIAKELGISKQRVDWYLKKYKIERTNFAGKRRERVLEMYRRGADSRKIAEELNLGLSTIRMYLREEGISEQRDTKERNEKKAFELFDFGYTSREVARRLDLSWSWTTKAKMRWRQERKLPRYYRGAI